MTFSKRLMPLTFVAAALTAVASPAQAVETITITGPSGTFGNDSVVCPGDPAPATCAFTNTFNFITPEGYNLTNATISTTALGGNNINFTSVFLNGMAFTLTPTGTFEFGTLANAALDAGFNNVLTVNGQNSGDSSFAGTLVFAAVPAVPEPATWGMMLLGFGAIGASLRRRRRSLPALAQAL